MFGIEVNVVFCGTMLPVERRPLSAKTGDLFGIEFEVPLLARAERYADKLVAALDRQHPRDLQAKGLLGPENTFDHCVRFSLCEAVELTASLLS